MSEIITTPNEAGNPVPATKRAWSEPALTAMSVTANTLTTASGTQDDGLGFDS